MTFGSYLRTVRERARDGDPAFSLRRVAQRVGVEPAYLSKIELGRRSTTLGGHHPPSVRRAQGGPRPSAGHGRQGVTGPAGIIVRRPQLFADLLRQLRDAPDHAILRLVREVRDGDW